MGDYARYIQASVSLVVRGAEREDVFADMARVHKSHRPGISAGRIFTLECNGNFVPLVARGAPRNKAGEIWIDLETRSKLGELDLNTAYEFKLHSATWGECLKWAWFATNPAYRVSSKISLVSLVLGVIGLLLGILSLLK